MADVKRHYLNWLKNPLRSYNPLCRKEKVSIIISAWLLSFPFKQGANVNMSWKTIKMATKRKNGELRRRRAVLILSAMKEQDFKWSSCVKNDTDSYRTTVTQYSSLCQSISAKIKEEKIAAEHVQSLCRGSWNLGGNGDGEILILLEKLFSVVLKCTFIHSGAGSRLKGQSSGIPVT